MTHVCGGYVAVMTPRLWRLCGGYDTCLWRLRGGYDAPFVAVVWRLCGGCVAVVWRLCGGCVAVVWRLCGGCVAVVWRLCGAYVALMWRRCDRCACALSWLEVFTGSDVGLEPATRIRTDPFSFSLSESRKNRRWF
jgi:hypothetical protein